MNKNKSKAKLERFEVRCYVDEKRRWKKLADQQGVSVSAIIREKMNGECDNSLSEGRRIIRNKKGVK
jgi:hypothetical protein